MVPDFIVKHPKDDTITIVVSKAVSKRAVDRNRIRRTIKEALRALGYQQGLTIIVKNNIAHLAMQEVKVRLKKCL